MVVKVSKGDRRGCFCPQKNKTCQQPNPAIMHRVVWLMIRAVRERWGDATGQNPQDREKKVSKQGALTYSLHWERGLKGKRMVGQPSGMAQQKGLLNSQGPNPCACVCCCCSCAGERGRHSDGGGPEGCMFSVCSWCARWLMLNAGSGYMSKVDGQCRTGEQGCISTKLSAACRGTYQWAWHERGGSKRRDRGAGSGVCWDLATSRLGTSVFEEPTQDVPVSMR